MSKRYRPPEPIIKGDIAYIPLTLGLFAKIDVCDLSLVGDRPWYAAIKKRNVYAMRRSGRSEFMHRTILSPPDGMEVDHIDGDGLNNTSANLRVVTGSQNCANVRIHRDNKVGFKGVSHNGNKYRARIFLDGTEVFIGAFCDPLSAAIAYDVAAFNAFGEHSRLNLPSSPWPRTGGIDV